MLMVDVPGRCKVMSTRVFTVQFFQLCCMCEHSIINYWEKTIYRPKEAHLLVLFTATPSVKSQIHIHLLESSNQSCEAGIIPI